MELDDLLRVQPKLHRDALGQPHSWQLSNDALCFIDAHVREGSKTLETGGGVSTIMFALKGAEPYLHRPGRRESDPYQGVLPGTPHSSRHSHAPTRPIAALPARLDFTRLDLVLIDGAHGFPIPFLDWYYPGSPT
jgi:hypothetical protein